MTSVEWSGVAGNPIPSNSIVPITLQFRVTRRPPPADQRKDLKATATLIDQNAGKHKIRLSFKGPGVP